MNDHGCYLAVVLLSRKHVRHIIWIALCVCLLVGCGDPPSDGPGITSKIGVFEIPIAGRPRLDLLFVVDDSSEMTRYQAQLVASYSKFADTLAGVQGGTPDINVAVTTGDPAAGGALRTASSVSGPVLIDGMRDGVRIQNYTGTLGAAMTELLDAGTAGATGQHVLDAIPLALDQNAMLVREHAYLAVVLIAASDDASSVEVAALAAELKARRSDPSTLLMIGVYAQPAPRLDAFLEQFPYRNAHTAIDASDPSAGLRDLTYFKTTLGSPCLEWTPFDVDPEMVGGQYECSVVETTDSGIETLLPRCGSEQPCWDFVPDPLNCLSGEHLGLRIERGFAGNPYEHTIVRGQCLIE